MSNVQLPEFTTVAELNEILAQQWGPMLPLLIGAQGDKQLKRTQYIPVTCMGCKTKRQVQVQVIPDLSDDGQVCDCGFPYNLPAKAATPTPVTPTPVEVQAAQPDPTPEPPQLEVEEAAVSTPTPVVAPTVEVEEATPEPEEEPQPEVVARETVVPTLVLSEEEKEARTLEHETQVIARLGEVMMQLDEKFGFSVFDANLEYGTTFNDETSTPSMVNFVVKCEVCEKTQKWETEEELFDPTSGIEAIIELSNPKMGSYEKGDVYHNCRHCVTAMAENAGINPYLLDNAITLAAPKGLKVDLKNLRKLHSPNVRFSLLGEDGRTLTASLVELQSSKIQNGAYKKKEEPAPAKKAAEKKVEPPKAPTPVAETRESVIPETQLSEMFHDVESIVTLPQAIRDGSLSDILEQPKGATFVQQHDAVHQDTEESPSPLRREEERRQETEQRHDENRVFGKTNRFRSGPNPFQRPEFLLTNFQNSSLGRVIGEVGRLSEIPYKLILDQSTLEIPVVDFETGVRIICVDLNKPALVHLPEGFDNQVPFGYKGTTFSKFYLYSDSAEYRTEASVLNLTKLVQGHQIGEEGFPKDHVVNLADYTTFYTTSGSSITEFEMRNSPVPYGKPSTGRILLLAVLDVQRQMDQNELWKFFVSNRRSFQDMNMYAVASMRWIALDGPTEVKYTITQYVELGETWLRDGFKKALAALAKEHNENFPGKNYVVELEYDRSAFTAPSVKWYMENEQGLFIMPSMHQNNDWVYLKDHSPEFRHDTTDYMRQDQRFFTVKTLINRYSGAMKEAGIDGRDSNQRAYFIKSLGFIRCTQPTITRLMVNPLEVLKSTMESFTMFKIDPAAFLTGGITSGEGDENASAQNFLMMKVLMDTIGNSTSQEQPAPQASGPSDQAEEGGMDMNQLMLLMAMMNNG